MRRCFRNRLDSEWTNLFKAFISVLLGVGAGSKQSPDISIGSLGDTLCTSCTFCFFFFPAPGKSVIMLIALEFLFCL